MFVTDCDAVEVDAAAVADEVTRLSTYCLCDKEIEFLFPPPARRNRGYLNMILRCKCGYSPTVHVTKEFPPGRIYYKCGSTDVYNQCEFFIYKAQFDHTIFDLCCCGQPFKIAYERKHKRKFLCCPYYPSPEGCLLTYDKRQFPELG